MTHRVTQEEPDQSQPIISIHPMSMLGIEGSNQRGDGVQRQQEKHPGRKDERRHERREVIDVQTMVVSRFATRTDALCKR